jgi:hypothetical protein
MLRRRAIIIELQERVRRIKAEIEEEKEKIEDIEVHIQQKTEDLKFHRVLLHELGVISDIDIDEAEEGWTEEEEVGRNTPQKIDTSLAESEQSPAKLTRAQYQEQKDKARAWHLDREREARAKGKSKKR